MSILFKKSITRRDFVRSAFAVVPLVMLTPRSLFASMLSVAHVRRTTFVMGSIATIEAYGPDEKLLHHAITEAFAELHRLDAMMSLYDPASVVCEINRHAGKKAVEVPQEVIEVISAAQRLHKQTQGSFDITVEPLMKLWGFRDETGTLMHFPTDTEIVQARLAIGYDKINVDVSSIALTDERSKIDLGGIAVGYALDRAAAILEREGVTQALINHSGDIIALDAPPDGGKWHCAIPNPGNLNELIHEFTIERQAVSTSGSYEKFVSFEGQRYGHIMTPFNGRPSEQLLSTTVIADRAIASDGLSTALFTMSAESAMSIGQAIAAISQGFLIEAGGQELTVRTIR